jgi:CubicO group peptidase (beta-lactamase class C family)
MSMNICVRVALAALLLVPAWVQGQLLPSAPPESVGMSSGRLGRIGQMVNRRIKEGDLVGAVTMVAREGKLVHLETFGHADLEAGKPMRPDTVFRIYSMTKPITSVAALMLFEEGRFQLSDPIHLYLPQFKDVKVYSDNGEPVKAKRPITVRDLLTHRSGLTYGIFGSSAVDRMYRDAALLRGDGGLAGFVDRLALLPLLHQPGERWNYSVSTDVLGRLVEVASGQTLDEFFRERIFDPLKMRETGFHVPEGSRDRFAVAYEWKAPGARTIADHPDRSRFARPATFFSGGGGLVSTIGDYACFAQMLLNGGEFGGVRLLSPKTVSLMTRDHTADAVMTAEGVQVGAGAAFGLGVRVVTDVARTQRLGSEGMYGWSGIASTSFFADPKEQLVGIIMSQKLPTDGRLSADFQTAVYQAIIDLNER